MEEQEKTARRPLSKKELVRNRVLGIAALAALAVLIVVIICVIAAHGDKKSGDYAQQGPFAADESTTILTGKDVYDFSSPVPERNSVDAQYFADALFVGGSHIAGLCDISAVVPGARILYSNSADVSGGTDAEFGDSESGGKITLRTALSLGDYRKIYLQFGTNELGWVYKDKFKSAYGAMIDAVRELAPDAQIYILSVMPVTQKKGLSSDAFNNANVNRYNSDLLSLAAEKEVFYLNIAAPYTDADGCLRAEVSGNGINIEHKYYGDWYDYLASHTAPSYVK